MNHAASVVNFTDDHPIPWGPDAESGEIERLKLLFGAELAAELPPLSYLIEAIGMVDGSGAPHLFAGYGFSGKTVALQSAMLSLAAGRGVWGVHLTQPRRVIHVDLEQGDRLTRRRYQRLALGMGLDLHEIGDNIAVAIMPPIRLTIEHEQRWLELMTGRDLIVVDSFRAAVGGEDENSSAIRAHLDFLGTLSERTNCRAAVIHHARKPPIVPSGNSPSFDVRGSGAIFDACDCVYQMGAAQGEPVKVQHTKARSHGEPVEDFALVIEDVEVEGDPRAALRVVVRGLELLDERREANEEARRVKQSRADASRVMAAIQKRPGLGTRELRAILRLSGDRFAAAIIELGAKVDSRADREPGRGGQAPIHHYPHPSSGS
jgi:hypothetical protein